MMEKSKKILYIGAHPDDLCIGAAITIMRNYSNAYVLTITDGAIPDDTYPIERGGLSFNNSQDYSKKRIQEDESAMSQLGVNFNYRNLRVSDQHTHQNIPRIVKEIRKIVELNSLDSIITHEFGEAHPDHEIASFCAHYVANQLGLNVWEYPMYGFDCNGKERIRRFLTDSYNEEVEIFFNTEEYALKNRLIKIYRTQSFIQEMFRRFHRDFSNGQIPDTTYFYKDAPNHPSPEQIRAAITSFLSQSKPI